MQYKSPKVLETEPSIAGFSIGFAVIIIVGLIAFIFISVNNFLMALPIPLVLALMIYIDKTYGGFDMLLKIINYHMNKKSYVQDKSLHTLLRNNKAFLFSEHQNNDKKK
jgi:type IV secretory pathway VirB3-like protein